MKKKMNMYSDSDSDEEKDKDEVKGNFHSKGNTVKPALVPQPQKKKLAFVDEDSDESDDDFLPKTVVIKVRGALQSTGNIGADRRICKDCNFQNHPGKTVCEMCDEPLGEEDKMA